MKKHFSLLLVMICLLSVTVSPVFAENNTLIVRNAPTHQFAYTMNNLGDIYGTSVFSALFKSTLDLQDVVPDLAKGYTVSDDQLTFVFDLRDDVFWHDGEKFTAEDVEFNIGLALKVGVINSIYVSAFSAIEGAQEFIDGTADKISGISIGDNSITIKMARPYGAFVNVLAQWLMLPQHLLQNADPLTLHTAEFWQWPIGTGAYKVGAVEWGNYAILERNDAYYGQVPKIERIRMTSINDVVLAAQAGVIDYFNTNNPDQIREISKLDDYEVFPVDTYFMRYFIMNIDSPDGINDSMYDVRVRKAILHALDRASIVEALFPNGELTDTFVPAGYPDYWADAFHYEYNPELARQLLNEAGFDFNKELKLRYYYSDQTTVDLMDLVVFYLGEVGIKAEHAKIQGDSTTFIMQTRDHDIVYKGLSAFGYEEAYGEMVSGANIMRNLVNDDVFDDLVSQLNATVDPEVRTEIIKELQKLDQEHLYRLPFFSLQNSVVVNTSRLKTAGQYGNEWWNYDRQFADWEILD